MQHAIHQRNTLSKLFYGAALVGLLLPAGFASAIVHDSLPEQDTGLTYLRAGVPDAPPAQDAQGQLDQLDLFNQDLVGVTQRKKLLYTSDI